MPSHAEHTRKILDKIESGHPVSQRTLAKELGIALGLTNLLVRRIVSKGWVKITSVKPNRISYLITPAGVAEKQRITRAYFSNTVRLYTETRERIRERLHALSTEWPAPVHRNGGAAEKRIVFYGAGEVAEIGYISLQGTDLRLVGIVDDVKRGSFFGLPVSAPEQLGAMRINDESFDFVVVMTFRRAFEVRARLEAEAFPPERVVWLVDESA
jgi:DNA-binding MarR family transcriptional regulator